MSSDNGKERTINYIDNNSSKRDHDIQEESSTSKTKKLKNAMNAVSNNKGCTEETPHNVDSENETINGDEESSDTE